MSIWKQDMAKIHCLNGAVTITIEEFNDGTVNIDIWENAVNTVRLGIPLPGGTDYNFWAAIKTPYIARVAH